jgi:hypothetical protein
LLVFGIYKENDGYVIFLGGGKWFSVDIYVVLLVKDGSALVFFKAVSDYWATVPRIRKIIQAITTLIDIIYYIPRRIATPIITARLTLVQS